MTAWPPGPVGNQDAKGRQIAVLGAQPITRPGAETGAPGLLVASLEEGDAGIMVDGFGVHRLHEAQVIGNPGRVREQIAEPRAAPAVLPKRPVGTRDRKGRLPGSHSGQTLRAFDETFLAPGLRLRIVGLEQFLAMIDVEHGFVVEQILLRRRAVHEQKNDPLGFRCEMGSTFSDLGGECAWRQERTQGQGTNARRPGSKPVSTGGEVLMQCVGFVHARNSTS